MTEDHVYRRKETIHLSYQNPSDYRNMLTSIKYDFFGFSHLMSEMILSSAVHLMPYTTESNLIHLRRIGTWLFDVRRRATLNGLQGEIDVVF